MPKTNSKNWQTFFIRFFIILIAYMPVAAGSPGPFDKKIPLGLSVMIYSAEASHGTTITSQ